jgi:hypothetical protein
VPDLFGCHVHDQVFVLAFHTTVPPLHQVLHGDCHFAERAAEQLLQLLGVNRVGLLGLDVELHVIGVPKHQDL